MSKYKRNACRLPFASTRHTPCTIRNQYATPHVGPLSAPRDPEIMLEGVLCAGYARMLKLRKLNGK